MALSRVKIANFKSLREIEIDLPTDLVALVGRNNSGKSALLDAILLAAETTRLQGQSNPPPVLDARGGWTELTFGKSAGPEPIVVELAVHGAAD